MIGSAETISTHYLYRYICHKNTAKQREAQSEAIPPSFCCLPCRREAMKTCICLVTLSLALAFVNAFSTEEHVKRFFRPDHRALLPETTSLEFRDEPALLTSSQNDESTIKVLGSWWAILWEAGCTSIFNVSNQNWQTSYFKEIRETNLLLRLFQ